MKDNDHLLSSTNNIYIVAADSVYRDISEKGKPNSLGWRKTRSI